MNIDNVKQIKKLDTGLVSESIESLPDQIEHLLNEVKDIKIPSSYKKVSNIVLNGMGGSNLGARIIRSAMKNRMKYSIAITPGYVVPKHISKDTLYIVSSYSGTTEEPLSVFRELKKRKAKVLAITAGGKLEKIMKKDNIPGLVFSPTTNPSNQSRLGLGYSIFGLILLMNKIGLVKVTKKEMLDIIESLRKQNKSLTISSTTTKNAAKKIAKQLFKKQPILIGADFLVGNLHTMRNQMCENAKNIAFYMEVPDMNHFAMEGLSHPKENKKIMHFLFFDSKLYHQKVQKRLELTKKVIKKNGINCSSYTMQGKTSLEQAFELLQLGTWITYYVGLLNEVDPIKIPWVDWFKKQLEKK
jgi:glucose/mannose-6-phosphate isomerase